MSWLVDAAAQTLNRPASTLRADSPIASGQALKVQRITSNADQGSWVAKQVHPALKREIHAYRTVLREKYWAPTLHAVLQGPQGEPWLLLGDGGEPLSVTQAAERSRELGELAAAMHSQGQVPWWPPIPWPRPVHVRHGQRFLLGELRIARNRLVASSARDHLPQELVPSRRECSATLGRAWDVLSRCQLSFIHGDLNPTNVLWDGHETLQAVDYSQWGRGPWLWDVASLTMSFPRDVRRELLHHYLNAHPSPPAGDWEKPLEYVRSLRVLITWGALAELMAIPEHASRVQPYFLERTQTWEDLRWS